VSDRERKRAERRKRKRRSVERAAAPPGKPATPTAEVTTATAPEAAPSETFQDKMARRYEERNAEARAQLTPLRTGERPRAVTIGAIVSAVFAGIISVSAVLATAGVGLFGANPAPREGVGIGLFAVGLWVMVWGMWRARYWAVLGFQTLLLAVLVLSALSLVVDRSVYEFLVSLILLVGSGTLFYFMIRAMARIQMPRFPGGE
jgi:hypothetical protein